jgi:hypothetical protein
MCKLAFNLNKTLSKCEVSRQRQLGINLLLGLAIEKLSSLFEEAHLKGF